MKSKTNRLFSIMLTSFLLIVAVLSTIGTTYSLWTFNDVQTSTNTVASGCFELKLEENNAINLTNTYPMNDEKGKKQTPYTFTIKNTCTIAANYTVVLNVLNNNSLEDQYVKYYIDGANAPAEKTGPASVSTLESYELKENDPSTDVKKSYTLFSGSLPANNGTATYNLHLWVGDNATNDQMDKTFKAKLFINSYPTKIAATKAIRMELTNINSGLVEFNHDATSQTPNLKAYRYVGTNPANYVTFNNELWRVVGVFEVINDNKKEERIKIVRDEPLDNRAWIDARPYLNSEYFNSLTEQAKNQIASTIIYTSSGENNEILSANQLYLNERSLVTTTKLNENSNVDLLYASDYAFASGLYCRDTNILETSNCTNNWLNNQVYWTNYGNNTNAYYVNNNVLGSDLITASKLVKPAVYLKSNIKLECDSTKGICGNKDNPYTLKGE